MLGSIPADLLSPYNGLLETSKVPESYRIFYLKWLRFYLDFCGKYDLETGNPSLLPLYLKKLESKKQSENYFKQAEHAIKIYYQLVEREKNLSRPDSITRIMGQWQNIQIIIPRKARLDVPGALQHIMNRSLPLYRLFSDDKDRQHSFSFLS